VVIDQINVGGVAIIETENDPPVGAHRNGPKAFELAGERVEPEGWKIHVFDLSGRVRQA
jgi:hypothetical protein